MSKMRLPSFMDPIVDKLRGEHKSIRYRFWTLPKEWVVYSLYRATGRSWIDFYSQRLDGFITNRLDAPPPESYLAEGREHFDFLARNGLVPEHAFLDYGCGVFRLGRHVIPYLRPGHYVGMEIAAMRIEKGLRLLSKEGISTSDFEAIVTRDCLLKELGTRKFDVVWAKSVFTHMPEGDIKTMLTSLKKHLNPGAVYYFTFTPAEKPMRAKIKDFYHPPEYMRQIVENCGYEFEICPDWPIDRYNDLMARVKVKT
jgi:SAM-dependent methyltransferase